MRVSRAKLGCRFFLSEQGNEPVWDWLKSLPVEAKTKLAERMQTSRTVVNRLLDPNDTSFTFGTLAKASQALDLDLLVSLETRAKPRDP